MTCDMSLNRLTKFFKGIRNYAIYAIYAIWATKSQFFHVSLTIGFETTKQNLNGSYSNLSKKPTELIGFLPIKSLEGHYGYKLREKM